MLDLGLTRNQRSILEAHCSFIEAEQLGDMKIWVLQAFPHLVDPQCVVAIIDSDIIITSRLDRFFDEAATGKTVVFPEPECPNRNFAEWANLFDLRRPLRSGQLYVNAGCIFFSTLQQPDFLERWWDCCVKIKSEPTFLDHWDNTSPLAFGEQDALNALLMSESLPHQVSMQSWHVERYFDTQPGHVSVQDLERLECRHEGHEVSILHRAWVNKPWQPGSWHTVKRTAYSRCLRRVLVAKDVEIQVPRSELPVWLEPGPVGYAVLQLLFVVSAIGRTAARLTLKGRCVARRNRKRVRRVLAALGRVRPCRDRVSSGFRSIERSGRGCRSIDQAARAPWPDTAASLPEGSGSSARASPWPWPMLVPR